MNADFDLWAAELNEQYTIEQEPTMTGPLCVCGCPESRHRAGDDCGECGRFACPAFREPHRVSVTVTVGWFLILAAVVLFLVGVGWVASNIIQWLGA